MSKKLYEMWDMFSADSAGLISTTASADTVKEIWQQVMDDEAEIDEDDCPIDRLVKELNKTFPGTERVYVDEQIWA